MRITVRYSNGTNKTFKSFDDITDNDNVIELMKEVRDKHTFINRINALFWFINQYKEKYF